MTTGKGIPVKTTSRYERIVSLVNEHGFLSVSELSRLCDVSEMTTRRDLELLDTQHRIRRTYGGAVSVHTESVVGDHAETTGVVHASEVLLIDQVDVLIATSVNPYYDGLLIDRARKKNIPIIAESIEMPNQLTEVAVDNYQAAVDLGVWAGKNLVEQGIEKAFLLDLTFHQPNTQKRSRGFIDGLAKTCPSEVVLSINAQSRYAMAYQLAYDALTVYPQINLIFAINDTIARGAIDACRNLNIDPKRMNVIVFGLEGDTFKNELMAENSYCKVALAMFPEIVSFTCIEAAIAAFNHKPLPKKCITPHVVLTAKTLTDYYAHTSHGWELNWEFAREHLNFPLKPERDTAHLTASLHDQIGFLVPFTEHEWYKNLTSEVIAYAGQYKIGVQVIDADQNVRDEVEIRRRQIANKAATLVDSGDVVLIDGGPIAGYLAEELKHKKDITVITNSVTVLDILNHTLGITLISTGGTLRYSSQVMVGPTAEGALKELRADKLFLMVSGISLDFGLSHQPISEITIKQAMIRSTHEVILLADHTSFGEETGIQVAPLTVVQRLITDDALPPSIRLNISKAGIQIIIV
jgi:DeoR/GlpR family transcriptional regulator of sugar metabolism/ABC-type sugar transport system substrate-binding protein